MNANALIGGAAKKTKKTVAKRKGRKPGPKRGITVAKRFGPAIGAKRTVVKRKGRKPGPKKGSKVTKTKTKSKSKKRGPKKGRVKVTPLQFRQCILKCLRM